MSHKEEGVKPTFKEIYEPIALGYETKVLLMQQGRPVLRKYAEAVLRALSAYTGKDYSL